MNQPRYEATESRCWKNARTGMTASIYGAAPYTSDADAKDWSVITVGYTVKDNVQGTVGIGRKPFATKAEAETVAGEMEERRLATIKAAEARQK
jgi:hypothetical protein